MPWQTYPLPVEVPVAVLGSIPPSPLNAGDEVVVTVAAVARPVATVFCDRPPPPPTTMAVAAVAFPGSPIRLSPPPAGCVVAAVASFSPVAVLGAGCPSAKPELRFKPPVLEVAVAALEAVCVRVCPGFAVCKVGNPVEGMALVVCSCTPATPVGFSCVCSPGMLGAPDCAAGAKFKPTVVAGEFCSPNCKPVIPPACCVALPSCNPPACWPSCNPPGCEVCPSCNPPVCAVCCNPPVCWPSGNPPGCSA